MNFDPILVFVVGALLSIVLSIRSSILQIIDILEKMQNEQSKNDKD